MNRQAPQAMSVVVAALLAGAPLICRAEMIYGISSGPNPGQTLVAFDSATPGTIASSSFISGLQPNEVILGIDVRPATGELYALGSTSRLYKLAPATAAATPVSATPFGPPLLNGVEFGFDFNPTIDRIRVVSDTNKNSVLNPITGALQLAATDLAYGAADVNAGRDPNIVDAAYSNNFVGATTSQLYGIDTGLDILTTQANNTGVLGTVGPLGLDVAAAGGFDISGASGIAYAVLLPVNAAQSSLYRVNLATGAATTVGVIGGGLRLTALTVAPSQVPEPTTFVLAGLAMAGIGCSLRRGRRA